MLVKIWNVQRPIRLVRDVQESIKEEDDEGIFEEGIDFLKREVEGRNLEANEKSLFILILTIRIHSEVVEVSIRKRTMDEVVVSTWSQNGCQ